jgi:ammonium transporter Rh
VKRSIYILLIASLLLVVLPIGARDAEAVTNAMIVGLRQVEQYNFSINILAMLLVGFGFLMVFVKKYGYSATTGTFLVVGAGLPLYLFLRSSGFLSAQTITADNIRVLILAEFAVASALIAMGAVLGRLRTYQYGLVAVFTVIAYTLNEWLVLDGGLGITKGLALALTQKNDLKKAIESDETSDRLSMIGSMVLWIFWPSFCCALVPPEQMPQTAINTIMALCGATLITYVTSVILRKGKPSFGDITNASLAGGVAIGATCNLVTAPVAFGIGLLAGALCVIGYVVIQPGLQSLFKMVDTCGVHNLHGMPGLLGGIIAVFVVPGCAKAQLTGIVVTIILALISGVISGYIIKVTGSKLIPYEDREEF